MAYNNAHTLDCDKNGVKQQLIKQLIIGVMLIAFCFTTVKAQKCKPCQYPWPTSCNKTCNYILLTKSDKSEWKLMLNLPDSTINYIYSQNIAYVSNRSDSTKINFENFLQTLKPEVAASFTKSITKLNETQKQYLELLYEERLKTINTLKKIMEN